MYTLKEQKIFKEREIAAGSKGDGSRTVLWIGLGLLWLIDALLQAQPAMFTGQFVRQVLQPAAEGQPHWFLPLMQLSQAVWTGRIVAWALGAFWLVMAMFQAWPAAGFWTGKQLAALFASGAAMPQPAVLAAPIQGMTALAPAAPLLCNACFVVIMAGLGWAFLSGKLHPWTFALAGAWLMFSWWLGQDFGGLFTGMSTDPNTSLPLGVFLLAAAMAYRQPATQALQPAIIPPVWIQARSLR